MADLVSISSAAIGFVAFALQPLPALCETARASLTKLSLVTNDFAIHVRLLSPSIEKIEEKQAAGGYT